MSSSRPASRVLSLAKDALQDKTRRRSSIYSLNQGYLTGLRGILVIQSFVWLFFQTFIPALVSHAETRQPFYQVVLRKAFSPVLWEPSLLYSFFIILSARTVCIHFLQDASTPKFARSLISRPIRIGVPISIALAISMAVFSTIDTSYISQAASAMENSILKEPAKAADATIGFNSIYNILWVYRDFSTQMGNKLWPSETLWTVSLVYYQSYTVYAFMVILPFTRPGWHLQGLIWFGLGSFWFNTWGWYSAIGLLVADLSINPALRSALTRGMRVPKSTWRIPYWAISILFILAGLAMKYIWIAAFPSHINTELHMHPAKYFQPTDGLGNLDVDQPYPRLDNALIIVGVLLALEASEEAQIYLCSPFLKYFGDRSLSKHD